MLMGKLPRSFKISYMINDVNDVENLPTVYDEFLASTKRVLWFFPTNRDALVKIKFFFWLLTVASVRGDIWTVK